MVVSPILAVETQETLGIDRWTIEWPDRSQEQMKELLELLVQEKEQNTIMAQRRSRGILIISFTSLEGCSE